MKKISIIIPAYNEERTIRKIYEKVLSAPVWSLEKEIIIVDNNSTDDTYAIACTLPGVKAFLEKEKGKGAAVKRGFREATGDVVLIQDADLEYDPNDYEAVIKPILNGTTEIVNGVRIESRFNEGNQLYIGLFGWLGNSLITLLTNILYNNDAKEYEGCYKAFTKSLVDSVHVKTNSFDFDNELLCKAYKKGYMSIDVPIHYYPRDYSQGKHINWKHGVRIVWTIIKYRFVD